MGNLKQVKKLIKRMKHPMTKDINGDCCLHYAALFHQFEILKYLIEEVQCPPNAEGWNGSTVLHLAAQTAQFNVVQYLVESKHCKLDPTIEDHNGHSALHYACSGGDCNIVSYLIGSMSEYMKLEDMLYSNYDNSSPANSNAETGESILKLLYLVHVTMEN